MSFFEAVDPIFDTFVMGNAPVRQIATGFDWVEGPVWFGDAGCLLFSDIPNDRIMRWTPGSGVSVYRQPSNYANGHTATGRAGSSPANMAPAASPEPNSTVP